MRTALITDHAQPPTIATVSDPAPTADEVVLDLVGAGVHPLVRARAAGLHYSADSTLPLVPGIDGVGRDANGRMWYFTVQDRPVGSIAERIAVGRDRLIPLASDADPLAVAAGVNPLLSSWGALTHRATLPEGGRVLVLGATGSAGRLAVQLSRLRGAGSVVAVGRDAQRLGELAVAGAETVSIADGPETWSGELAAVAADVDVVLDYLWGGVTAAALPAIATERHARGIGAPLTWVTIGSMAGADAAIPSQALRSLPLQLTGSGIGAVRTSQLLAELPAMVAALGDGSLTVDARPAPLADLPAAWATGEPDGRRVVVVP